MTTKILSKLLLALAISYGGAFAAGAQDTKLPSLPNLPLYELKIGHWDDIIYGDPAAPVQIIEFASLTCSHCGDFARNIFPLIKAKYLDTGKARLHLRNFVRDRTDLTLAVVARCKDNQFAADLTKAFLVGQAEWMADNADMGGILLKIAADNGLSEGEFDTCLDNQDLQKHLISVAQKSEIDYSFEGTPGVFINDEYVGEPLWTKIDTMIKQALIAQ